MNKTTHDMSETRRPGCQAFDLNLAAYLEGEDRPNVTRHARECSYCKVLLADLERVREASASLPLPEPPTRLWANIRATLVEEGVIRARQSFWQRWFPSPRLAPEARPMGALLALATMALILIASTGRFESPRRSDILASRGTVITAGIVAPGLTPALAQTVGQMEAAFRAQEDSFEPAMKATYKKSLEALDESIRETMGQCERHPDDLLARQYLVNAYQTKAEVLASALEFSR
ncbi:MAG: hypothetical protein HY508_13065 [Acidobacteria bacterium]|nr:hypothetical protein [Acidobacteriota bacterium]